jgi:hypothetical protein
MAWNSLDKFPLFFPIVLEENRPNSNYYTLIRKIFCRLPKVMSIIIKERVLKYQILS